jgi:hypothetical protein
MVVARETDYCFALACFFCSLAFLVHSLNSSTYLSASIRVLHRTKSHSHPPALLSLLPPPLHRLHHVALTLRQTMVELSSAHLICGVALLVLILQGYPDWEDKMEVRSNFLRRYF